MHSAAAAFWSVLLAAAAHWHVRLAALLPSDHAAADVSALPQRAAAPEPQHQLLVLLLKPNRWHCERGLLRNGNLRSTAGTGKVVGL